MARHVYVHVPFCSRRCSYCDFSIAVRREVPVAAYVTGLAAECAVRLGDPAGATVDTLYFGGGTPSKLGADGVAQAVDALRPWIVPAPDAEVTLEANPEDVTPDAARAWAAAGINRVSLGVQSFQPAVLAWMHRTHVVTDVPKAMHALRSAGITDISLDLIFAVPDDIPRDWSADVAAAIALEPTHMSCYGLTVEPATPLGRWTARGAVEETPDDRYAEEFMATHGALTRAGYTHYEVSNYARAGHEARHNASYWRGVPYLGLGPSAHGFDGAVRRWNLGAYAHWLAELSQAVPRDPLEGTDVLDPSAREAETVYLGLRTREGLDLRDNEWGLVAPWVAAGWATHDGGRLTLSADGWLRMDALAAALTAHRSN